MEEIGMVRFMKRWIGYILALLSRLLFSLRYRLEIKGLENLTPEKLNRPGGVLFLPNHPAYLDPWFLFTYLWPRFQIRPLIIEYVDRIALLKPLIRFVRSIPIPNFDVVINPMKVRRAERAM